jgi:hypothetical protein
MDIDLSQNELGTAVSAVKLINQYIQALLVNVNRNTIPTTINLIFDSGAVNGVLGIGAALYIHNLEQNRYFQVKKVSGCSIGSFIALWYIYGCPEELYKYSDTLFTYYKTHKNFYIYETIVKNVIDYLIPDDDNMSKINDRLYINYYDTKKRKNCIISHFKNKNHLITCILRSSHVPFLTSQEHKYQGRYVDGIVPHIFTDQTTNLFVKLINFTDPLNCLKAKNEQNIYSRLLRGVVGANDFFVNGQTDLCSYIDYTSYSTILNLYIRKQIILIVLTWIEWALIIHKNIPLSIQNTTHYNKIMLLSKTCWNCLQNKLV